MLKKVRLVSQGIVLALVMLFAYLHTLDNIYPSSHALCPFGGLASLYSVVTTGAFIHRTHASSLVLLLAVILTALLAGRIFCAWLCPLGTLGEWVHKLARKAGLKKSFLPPANLDRILRYVKYLVLAFILYFAWTLGHLFYKGACPWAAFMTIFEPAELVEDVLAGGVILLLVLGASLFVERFFCRYLCPLGAALSIFNRFSLIKPSRERECRSCQLCDKVCPSGIHISEATKINHGDCIRCYACVDKCPDKGSLSLNIKPLKPALAGFLAVLVFAGTIAVSAQAGYWEKGRKVSRDSGQGTGILNLSEELQAVKGSTKLRDISEAFQIPLNDLYRLFDIPENLSPESTITDISEVTGISRRHLLELLESALGSFHGQ